MTAQQFVKRWWWAIALIILGGIIWDQAKAGGSHCCATINNITEITTITDGISGSELAEGLSATAAAGSHQFDMDTYDFQGSITGSWISGDEDENAVSFGLAKRWEKVDALFHSSFTQINSDNHLFTVGGTFRF